LGANTCGRVVIGASDRLEKLSRASQVQRNAQLAFLYLAGYVPLASFGYEREGPEADEREAQRNVELMWLTRRLTPDFKTIANFRKDNGKAIRNVCRQFVVLCQQLDLFSDAVVPIDGSNFQALKAATAISPMPSSSAGCRRSRPTSPATLQNSTRPTGRNPLPGKRKLSASTIKSPR
jgi:hypothetical protein